MSLKIILLTVLYLTKWVNSSPTSREDLEETAGVDSEDIIGTETEEAAGSTAGEATTTPCNTILCRWPHKKLPW